MGERRGATTHASFAVKILLSVAAILAVLIGLALIFATNAFMSPMGIVLDARTATLGQAQGVVLISLGVINWLSRASSDPHPVLAGNAFAQIAPLAVNARAMALGLVGSQAGGAVVMHLVLGGLFLFFLVKGQKKATLYPRGVLVEEIFRKEYGRVFAGIVRHFGDFQLAEDAIQDAFVIALDVWPQKGVPDKPTAWITTVARNGATSKL